MIAQVAASRSRTAAVRGATLAACALVASLVVGKATRDGLFLSTFSATALPNMMTASAVASLLAALGMARSMAASSPGHVLIRGLAASTALLLLEWALALTAPGWGAVAVHLHLAVFGATLLSAFWSHLNESFDPYSAKKVVAQVGVGAAVGGLFGGALAWAAVRFLPIPTLLGAMALLNGSALLLLGPLRSLRSAEPGESGPDAQQPVPVSLGAAVRILREGSYVRDLGLIVGLGALTEALLDFSFNAQAATTFPKGPALVSFFAIYQAGVGLAVLLAQLFLARRSLKTLGLAGTVAARSVALVGLGGLALLIPGLSSLLLVRSVQNVLSSSLFRSGYELLFTPIPPRRKRPIKTLVDVGFDKLGALLGSVVTLVAVAALALDALRVVIGLAVLAGIVSLTVTRRLHRGYVAALEDSLRSGVLKLEREDVTDGTTRLLVSRMFDRKTLLHKDEASPATQTHDSLLIAIADLRAASRTQILRALPRDRDPDVALVPFLIPLLARDDVGPDVLKTLRRVAPRVTGQLLDALLDPQQDPVIRRRLPRVLVAAPGARAAEGLLRALEDSEFEVRRRCALALASITDKRADVVLPRDALLRAVARELEPSVGGPGQTGRPGPDDDGLDPFSRCCLSPSSASRWSSPPAP